MTSNPLPSFERSALMARVRGRDTQPEMFVRRFLHRHGYRFRLHAKDLPGCPDIVFRNRQKVIFVHGCFWHRHEGCKKASLPKTRASYWRQKLEANRARDVVSVSTLENMGWKVMIVWECEILAKDSSRLFERLVNFLDEM